MPGRKELARELNYPQRFPLEFQMPLSNFVALFSIITVTESLRRSPIVRRFCSASVKLGSAATRCRFIACYLGRLLR